MRQVPSGASGGRGLNGLIFFLTRKFHETSVTRSRMRGKRAHRLDRHRLGRCRDHVEPRHAHQARLAVDFRRARAALAGLAIPAAGEVVGLRGLDLVDDVEHDHAFGGLGLVIDELARLAFLAERQMRKVTVAHFAISSMTCFSSSGIGGNRLAAQLHGAVRALLDDDVHLRVLGALVREILAEMAAAAFLALERASG